MKILLYGNGSSGNHGCEAIVRGTVEVLKDTNSTYIVHSESVEEDKKYGLEEIAVLKPAKTPLKKDFDFIKAYIKMKFFNDYTAMDGLLYQNALKETSKEVDVAFSVGGDNYCYEGTSIYGYLNRAYHKEGLRTILWGCSIEPEVVQKPDIMDDLKRYNLIVTRESITYDAVKKVNPNTILAPDPAFLMKAKECAIDDRMQDGNVVGINVSPMIVSNETIAGVTYENYKNLIEYILDNTKFKIALIPHVVWESNDDRHVLRKLYEDFNRDERIILVEDHNAEELKYILSKCRMFIGARTHATIAAYSSCVPTLVVGYSVKARGIAKDLFGQVEHYVIPVQSLKRSGELKEAFIWLLTQENSIRIHLETIIPNYKKSSKNAVEAVNRLK